LLHLLVSNIAQVILFLIALAFKDERGNSIFPLSPVELLWANLITCSFLALGLGLEEGQADIMYRPPHNLQVSVFTRELIIDKMIYGALMGSLCLLAFVAVVYGDGNGNLGSRCNQGYNTTCDVVYRARSTTFSSLTFLLLVTAWEAKHFSRSLFNLDPVHYTGRFSIFPALWRNRFLFWAVFAGFIIDFLLVYIPKVNRVAFNHSMITWEWGIVAACVVVYLALVESWKAAKRAFGIGSGKNKIITLQDAEMRIGLLPNESVVTASCADTLTLEEK
jgi:Na+-exporting ATPase